MDETKKMFSIGQRWSEPEDGSATFTASLTDSEAGKIQEILDWFNENGDDGDYLTWWEGMDDLGEPGPKTKIEHTGLSDVMSRICLDARYEEDGTPGSYYGGRCIALDEALGIGEHSGPIFPKG